MRHPIKLMQSTLTAIGSDTQSPAGHEYVVREQLKGDSLYANGAGSQELIDRYGSAAKAWEAIDNVDLQILEIERAVKDSELVA